MAMEEGTERAQGDDDDDDDRPIRTARIDDENDDDRPIRTAGINDVVFLNISCFDHICTYTQSCCLDYDVGFIKIRTQA